MSRNQVKSPVLPWVVMVTLLMAVSAFAQSRTQWRAAADIRNGQTGSIIGTIVSLAGDGFILVPDDDTREIQVDTSSATRFTGLGVDASDSQMGSAGLRELRTGDRLEVRGTGGAAATIRATEAILIGRSVAPPIPGVAGDLEGEIRDIRALDRSFVLETADGTRWTIVATETTPVMFQGETYTIRNLEVGDRVRVEPDTRLSSGEIRARRVHVVEDSTPDEIGGVRSSNYLSGRVERIESRGNRFVLRADRLGDIRVETSRAIDASGDPFRVADLKVGDRLRVWGSYQSANDFRAERIEFGSAEDAYREDEFRDQGEEGFTGFSTVVFYGTVERNPSDDDKIRIHDRDGDRNIDIVVDEEFVVLREAGSFVRSSQLRQGDQVVVKAFRDAQGNYIAQTIRLQ